MRSGLLFGLLFVGHAALQAGSSVPPASWKRLETSNLDLLTDANVAKGRELIERLIALQQTMPLGTRTLRIVLFRTDAELAPYKPANATAFYFSGRRRDYIVLSANTPGLGHVLLHEYVHAFLGSRRAQLPAWLNEGFAEVLSKPETPKIRDEVDLAALFKSSTLAPEQYPVARALVQMLVTLPFYQERLVQFAAALATGANHAAAFKSVYGKSIAEITGDLGGFVNARRLNALAIPANFKFPVSLKETDDCGLSLVEFLIDTGKTAAAQQLLDQIPDSPDVSMAKGDMALRGGDTTTAIVQYSRAIAEHTTNPRAYFERALLQRDLPDKTEQVIADLRAVLELDPTHAEARTLLEAVRRRSVPKMAALHPITNTIEGRLLELDCSATSARLIVQAGTEQIEFQISNPSDVLLKNAPESSITLPCGKLGGMIVAIDYVPDQGSQTGGKIRSIDFR